ncbi:sensor histidine kinase [Dysgonomonas sp. HGC4]|uniref:HAMP domain-containing sensor histidine kinase n=1 Tax=Dysgonomonas sp. HGC4 TaxID=1658009 RepID=UPI0006814AE0|nr:HAMP domain-containing sensor histidine kinase [Dysgonomonas sp. HGC4]MBD8347297.1 HAMP domain-containing histidine kinase [Dysgonomonas sp. HGC4]
MKIRTKIALRITVVITVVMLIFVALNYIVSTHVRKTEFYVDLKKEGISRANLYFKAKAYNEDMDKVDVFIYDKDYNLLYQDADNIKASPHSRETLEEIWKTRGDFTQNKGKYQTIGFIFSYQNADYIILVSAYDSYGHAKMSKLALYLLILSLVSLLAACALGYFLAKSALKPVARISNKMKDITANNLHLRLLGYNQKDEFGELADSFNKALDIIESSFNSQKMFVSNVSHELQTPLAILIGEIDLALLKDRTLEEYKQTLINSRQDTNKLIKFLNGLLDLAKASYDESIISMSIIRIDEVLLDARELVLKGNPNYNIEFLFNQDIEETPDMTFRGNEYLLRMAFANLMENNCKYSNNKTSIVKITSLDNKITLLFSDTGIGIPEDEIEHLFTPFYRGSNKSFTQGNGIGLALVKRVITLHKGSITLTSAVGKGTTFRVELS